MGSEENLVRKTEKEDDNGVVYKSLTYENGKLERLIVDDENGTKDSIFLYFSALTANLVMFGSVCTLAWSSPAFEKLKSTDLEVNPLGVPLTPIQESWIAALPCLGSAVGPLVSGKFADIYGRKKTLMLLAALEIISYIILAFATDVNIYYISRFLLGIGVGMCMAILPVYNAEICEDHNRGKFVCIMSIFPVLGVLYTLSIGPFLSLKMFTLSCTIPLIFALISFILIIPETPVFLALIDDKDNCIKALMKLRNTNKQDARKLLLEIMDHSSNSSKGGCIEMLKTRTCRKGLMICVGLSFFQQFSGILGIMAFIGPIFALSGSKISANLCSILVALVELVTVGVASILVERLGRRFLLLISIIGSSLSLIILGLYFHLKDNEFYYIQRISWLPLTSLMAYIIFFCIGLDPVPWIIISEVFPPNFRSRASSLIIIFGAFGSFSVTSLVPLLIHFIGTAWCFWFFGQFCALGAIFVYIIVPETKGKSVGDIQNILSK